MRRILLIGLVALPATLGLVVYGCGSSDEPPIEDFCGWLNDPNSCYRKFTQNIERPTMGTDALGVRCTNLSKQAMYAGQPQLGAFQTRASLDNCYLEHGGIIAFGTPVDLKKLPPAAVQFSFINKDTTPCGEFDFVADDNFKLHFDGDMVPDGGTLGPTQVADSMFSYARTATRLTVTATCGTEAHYFNRQQIEKCPGLSSGIPTAALDIIPTGLDNKGNVVTDGTGLYGALRFKVFLPPTTAGSNGFNSVPATQVDFFTCIIPPPPPLCSNMLQDGGESDVDCGGATLCKRCMPGLHCIFDSDCEGNAPCTPKMGIGTCSAVGTTSSTTGATTGATTSSTTGATTSTTAAGG